MNITTVDKLKLFLFKVHNKLFAVELDYITSIEKNDRRKTHHPASKLDPMLKPIVTVKWRLNNIPVVDLGEKLKLKPINPDCHSSRVIIVLDNGYKLGYLFSEVETENTTNGVITLDRCAIKNKRAFFQIRDNLTQVPQFIWNEKTVHIINPHDIILMVELAA